MYSPDVMKVYVALYEAGLEKLAEQYGVFVVDDQVKKKEEPDAASQR